MIFRNKQNNEKGEVVEKQDKKLNEVLEKIGVCQRLGYAHGCNCLNECSLVRMHLDEKYKNTELAPRK